MGATRARGPLDAVSDALDAVAAAYDEIAAQLEGARTRAGCSARADRTARGAAAVAHDAWIADGPEPAPTHVRAARARAIDARHSRSARG